MGTCLLKERENHQHVGDHHVPRSCACLCVLCVHDGVQLFYFPPFGRGNLRQDFVGEKGGKWGRKEKEKEKEEKKRLDYYLGALLLAGSPNRSRKRGRGWGSKVEKFVAVELDG